MNNNSFKVAIYARLSQQDKFTKESESIKNQIELAKIYCIKNNLTIKEIYIDDGYTGSNFERPNFKRMIEDIKQGKINTVITKDLSRLGRNLLGSGYYLEDFFPQHQVRYISINDNYDSYLNTNDDMIVLKNCINDLYVKECKKKSQQSMIFLKLENLTSFTKNQNIFFLSRHHYKPNLGFFRFSPLKT